MGYYSDPTASKAIGNINREFSRFEKKAKRLKKLLDDGVITPEEVKKAQSQFTGIYKHVLNNVLKESEPTDKLV